MSTITEKKKDGKVVAFKFQLCIGRDDQGTQKQQLFSFHQQKRAIIIAASSRSQNPVDDVKKFGYNFVIQGGVLHANYQIKRRSAQQLQ